MTKKHYILTLIVAVIAFSCKKIEPPIDESEANEPIYLLEGLVNDDSLRLYVNDTTVFISEAPYNMNGVEGYSSTISDITTGFELKMTVLRPEIYLDEEGVKLIDNGELDFLVHETNCKTFTFPQGSSQANYLGVEIDEVTTQGPVLEVKEFGKYNVGLTFPNINSQTYQLPFEIGFRDEILDPYFQGSGTSGMYYFTGSDLGYAHEWKIDGVVVGDDFEGEYELYNGIHRIKHTVVDAYENTATYTTLVYFQNGEYKWTLDSEYCGQNTVTNNYGRVLIEVLYNGVKYKSEYNPTNANNQIEVSDLVYVVNATTQSIDFVKFNLKFDAELKTEDNLKTLNLNDMNGTFHIAVN